MNAVFSWIANNIPNGIWVLIAILVTWFVAKFYHSHKSVKKTVDALPCDDHKNAIRKITEIQTSVNKLPCESHSTAITEFHGMKSTMESMNEQITTISKWVMHIDEKMIDPLAKKCSPRRMTDIGKKLYDMSGAKATVSENSGMLLSEMEAKAPATAFDVENVALDVLLANLANPMFNDVKNYIYYQPETVSLTDDSGEVHEVKISINVLIRLMGIELRDMYLAKHPDISSPQERGV